MVRWISFRIPNRRGWHPLEANVVAASSLRKAACTKSSRLQIAALADLQSRLREAYCEMRIAIITGPWFAVPPVTHGGIETLAHLLVEELVKRGEDVTLYSVGDSHTSGRLRWYFETGQERHLASPERSVVECAHAVFAYHQAARDGADIIHDHSGRVGPSLGSVLKDVPVLHTVHGVLTEPKRRLYSLLCGFPNIFLNTISNDQRAQAPELPIVATVYNAVDLDRYPLVRDKQRYIVCISRICAEKGIDLAIDLARRAQLPLKLAGRIEGTDEGRRYFSELIQPRLGGGIEYLGEVGFQQKIDLLANARALIHPVRWPEPFGLIAIEALACGTPVIATPRGALPEIIRHGIQGYLSDTMDGMLNALKSVDEILPENCRARVEQAFSGPAMVDSYEALYRRIVEQHAQSVSH
jgi:glycosyltransferase involved in cell wall biosynthesis